LGVTVQRTIADVLGRVPRAEDPKSFVAALNASFKCEVFEGRTVCTYQPRGYIGTSELGGAITGAQASLYLRAQATLDDALPLLERLEALRPDADQVEMEAVRSIVRDEFRELVKEMGLEGGPRVQRVDDLFDLLLHRTYNCIENNLSINDPANAALFAAFGFGEYGRLGDVFGLTRDRVNIISEEQNLTNYLIVGDYLRALETSWLTFRGAFLGGVDNYLGTQLVLLSRTLSVVAESVSEVYYAMNSVFLGPAERKMTRIDFAPGVPPMYVDDLFSWVQAFASDEGPRLIQDGGKRGVERIVPTLDRLRGLVRDSNGRIRHPGAQHPRVRRTIEELGNQLSDAARLAGTVQ
jgi:hypothetical protein